MNKNFINPFLGAVVNVLKTMARLDARPAKPMLKHDALARGDVTGFIGLTCDKAKGSMAITFPEEVIFAIGKNMLGETMTELDSTVTDMVGEITNMVTGGAKMTLMDVGYDFDMAIPSIVLGRKHRVSHPHGSQVIMLPFDTEVGRFFVEFAFRED